MLDTLVWAEVPLTLSEIAYLSGEQYVSYRLLGILNDLCAFIKTTRTSRGNCYEIIHSTWKEKIKERNPYGDILFRKKCSCLLKDISESLAGDNTSLLIDPKYSGEFWIFTHILSIYLQNSKDMLENWWEDIFISCFELIIQSLFKNSNFQMAFINSCNGADNYYLKDSIQKAITDYYSCTSTFDYDASGKRGYTLKDERTDTKLFPEIEEAFYSDLLNCLSIELSRPIQGKFHYMIASSNRKKKYDPNSKDGKKIIDKSYQEFLLAYRLFCDDGGDIYDEYINDALLCSYRIALIEKEKEEINAAACHLEDLINRIESISNIGIEMQFWLGKAYCNRGLIKKKSDVLNGVSDLKRALTIFSDLSELTNNVDHMDWKLYVENNLGDIYNNYGNLKNAITFWKIAISTIQRITSVSEEDYSFKLKSLYEKIGDAYNNLSKNEQAYYYYRKAYEISIEGSISQFITEEILKKIIDVYGFFVEKTEIVKFQREYLLLKKENDEYRDAYQEVVEVLRYTVSDDVKKIPKKKLEVFKEYQNKEHHFRIDTNKPFDEQPLMEKTKAIFANIFRDYWAYDSQRETIIAKENIERLQNRAKLMSELLKMTNELSSQNIIRVNEMDDVNLQYAKACSELFWILEYIPSTIALKVPFNILMQIKSYRKKFYNVNLSASGDNHYLPETLSMFAWIINEFIPDVEQLLNDFQSTIPDDFDLSIIFED